MKFAVIIQRFRKHYLKVGVHGPGQSGHKQELESKMNVLKVIEKENPSYQRSLVFAKLIKVV